MWSDSTTVLHWLNSYNKLLVFVDKRTDDILESTTINQWQYLLSGDNLADTGWVKGPSISKITDYPFKPDMRDISMLQVKGPSCDTDICFERASFFTGVSPRKITKNSIVKEKRDVAILFYMLLSLIYFRSNKIEITIPQS